MIVLVAGSRSIDDYALVSRCIEETGWPVEVLVHGGARGVDRLAGAWARANGVREKVFLPDWEGQGKRAGFLRNRQMVDYLKTHPANHAALVIWDGESRGAWHTWGLVRLLYERQLVVCARGEGGRWQVLERR